MKRVSALVLLLCLLIPLAVLPAASSGAPAAEAGGWRPSVGDIEYYTDIPGVTDEEISAIEALKKRRATFTYGRYWESQSQEDAYEDFTTDFFALLAQLFGVEFVPKIYGNRLQLMAELNARLTDFTCDLPAQAVYGITDPLAFHNQYVYALADTKLTAEADLNATRIGYFEGSDSIEVIRGHYPGLVFEAVPVTDILSAQKKLLDGDIDLLITDRNLSAFLKGNSLIRSPQLLQLAYIPIAFASSTPELYPIVSVVDKYLNAGAADQLQERYMQREGERVRTMLEESLTDAERAYLDGLAARGGTVRIGFDHDNYPISFYNAEEREFQGIAKDILDEIGRLTGIEFEIVSEKDTPWEITNDDLIAGRISLVPHLVRSEERAQYFIWSDVPYLTSQYALISKADFGPVQNFQIPRLRVGALKDSIFEAMYRYWFPDGNLALYPTEDEALEALERGELDLVMAAEYILTAQVNYREKTNYKINYRFHETMEACFGFNKDETELHAVINKAQVFVDTVMITEYWNGRVFNYSQKIAQMQATYASLFAAGVLIVLIFVFFMSMKNKQLGKDLVERTSRLSAIYTAVPDLLFSMDTDLRYTGCNSSFERFCNTSEKDLIGKTDQEVFGHRQDMMKLIVDINTQVLETQSPVVLQENVVNAAGEERIHETFKMPLIQNGKLTGLLGLSRDVTDHVLAEEEAREASKAKSAFLANMSHEIRTPMNAIIGMSELLMNETLTAQQDSYVKDINISSHALLGIINDILDISKIEAGKMELTAVDYDLHMLIENLRSMFQFIVRKKNLEFTYEEVGDMPKCLYGDDVRLRQVLTNICGNAVKFTREGSIGLKVTATDDTMEFEIRDTGIGIKPEDIQRLFDPFTQADTRKNRNITGTGLGLAISKTFAEMMGGGIKVDSVYGQGTAFTVSIPKIPGNEDAIGAGAANTSEHRFFAPDAKILVVDDNEINLKVAHGLLHLFQIGPDTALSGKRAIELVTETEYDIVFMDHMMPEMDGVETTKHIRALGGKHAKQTVIALTANAIQGAKEMFLMNGFDGFLSKPIDKGDLTAALERFLPPEKLEFQDTAEETTDPAGGAEAAPAKATGFLDAMGRIGGVNIDIALSHVSGLEDMYRETVELLVKKLPGECEKLESFLREKDLPNYAISVHAMKSSLATVGAMELSEAAAALEAASKAGEPAYCGENGPKLIERLRALHEQLRSAVQSDQDAQPRPAGDAETLRGQVQTAVQAAGDFEPDEAMAAIETLLAYDFGAETNELLQKARDELRDFNFDETLEALAAIGR